MIELPWEPHGVTIDNCGAGKGLELIPFQNVEVILGVPAWIAHNGTIHHPNEKKHTKPPSDGWADETFLIKYRIELLLTIPFLALLFVWYLKIGMKHDSAAQKPETLYKERAFMAYVVGVGTHRGVL